MYANHFPFSNHQIFASYPNLVSITQQNVDIWSMLRLHQMVIRGIGV